MKLIIEIDVLQLKMRVKQTRGMIILVTSSSRFCCPRLDVGIINKEIIRKEEVVANDEEAHQRSE
jgi:hypothetical protein